VEKYIINTPLIEAFKVAKYSERIRKMRKEIDAGTFPKERPIYLQKMIKANRLYFK